MISNFDSLKKVVEDITANKLLNLDFQHLHQQVWMDLLTGDSKHILQTFQSTMNTKMKESITQMQSKEHTLITTEMYGICTSTMLPANQQNFLQRQQTMQQRFRNR